MGGRGEGRGFYEDNGERAVRRLRKSGIGEASWGRAWEGKAKEAGLQDLRDLSVFTAWWLQGVCAG